MAVEELMTVNSTSPLALDPEEIRRLGYRSIDLASEQLAGIGVRRVVRPMPRMSSARCSSSPWRPARPSRISVRTAEMIAELSQVGVRSRRQPKRRIAT